LFGHTDKIILTRLFWLYCHFLFTPLLFL